MAAPTPNYNISPKLRFQSSSDNVSKHHRLLESPEFTRACDFALMQMFHEVSKESKDANTAAMNQMKLTGAQEFLHIFRTLGIEPARAPTIIDRDNLKQNV